MSITDILADERNRYIASTGLRPTHLYLGNDEYRAIKTLFEQFNGPMADVTDVRRLEWCGLPVFSVDAKNWVGFGNQASSPCG